MNKYLVYIILTGVLLIGGMGLYKYISKEHKVVFTKWYNKRDFSNKKNSEANIHVFEFTSPEIKIDTIFRSMQGPFRVNHIVLSDDKINFADKLFSKPEVYWLIGYSAEVINNKGEKIADDFLCHNNLDIYDNSNLPWKSNAFSNFQRVFTLTAGQTQLRLPEGMGIPVLGNTTLAISSQALNHNYPDTLLKTKQQVKIYYIKDSELSEAMIPLYQEAIFVTKQLSGPTGYFNSSPVNFEATAQIKVTSNSIAADSMSCCTGKIFDPHFNPYKDNYGRTYTGHWSFEPGIEVLNSDITEMLSLPYKTRIHYIGMHVHPFCTRLELKDKTTDKTIFKGVNKNHSDKIGLDYIDHFESKEGVELSNFHRYLLTSEYDNTSPQIQTGMATMFLYLEEK